MKVSKKVSGLAFEAGDLVIVKSSIFCSNAIFSYNEEHDAWDSKYYMFSRGSFLLILSAKITNDGKEEIWVSDSKGGLASIDEFHYNLKQDLKLVKRSK